MSRTIELMLYDVASGRGVVEAVLVEDLADGRVSVYGQAWTQEKLADRAALARRSRLADRLAARPVS